MRKIIKSSELKSIHFWMVLTTLALMVLLFSYTFIPSKMLQLLPEAQDRYTLFYDGSGRGDTLGFWDDQSDHSFQCIVATKRVGNYCGFQFNLGDFDAPVDLSEYETLLVNIHYQGPQDKTAVRLTFRGLEPSISTPREVNSYKHMNVALEIDELQSEITLAQNEWEISDYWVSLNKVPRQLHNIDFTNIIQFVVDLAQPMAIGTHSVKVENLTLQGAWILKEQWYLSMIALWLLVNISIIMHRVVKLDRRVHKDIAQIRALSGYTNKLKYQSEKYKALSSKDSLTGALNRNGLNEFVVDLYPDRFINNDASLLVLDIDHFKMINDTYGHAMGDHVLKTLSKVIMRIVRSTDGFCRWGGEEFIMLCPNTDEYKATKIAHKIRKTISELKFDVDGKGEFNVTVSIGVAQAHLNEHFEALFKRVDKALYTAKQSGRNRVDQAQSIDE